MSDKHTAALLAALERITEVAERCDSWQSFPQNELDAANAAIAKIRASEGQAQTSAAALEYIDKVAPEHDRTGCRESNPLITCRYEALDKGGCYRCTLLHAAQLADKTDPGAAEMPLPTKRYEFTSPDTGWFTAAQMRKYAADCVAAALTAQQSTAGGAVLTETSFDDYWWEARHQQRTQKEHARQAWEFALKSSAAAAPLMQVQPSEAAQDRHFGQGVIAALGVLKVHGYPHGSVYHDEIVQSVGESTVYGAAEDEDYEWAGLDPAKKPSVVQAVADTTGEVKS